MTQTVGGRYELGDPLGRGGMAEVRRAVDLRLGRAVAVKQLRPDLATDPTFQARFRREAQSAAGLNHPTIVAVYDTGEEPDPTTGVSIPYIVMELVEGPTLRDVLRDGRKILLEITEQGEVVLHRERQARMAWLAAAIEERLEPHERLLLERSAGLLGRLLEP